MLLAWHGVVVQDCVHAAKVEHPQPREPVLMAAHNFCRFSAANMSLVLAESRLLPSNSCLELVVGVTRRQAEEMEGVLDLETRVKVRAAVSQPRKPAQPAIP
jgi:hypothetical protein